MLRAVYIPLRELSLWSAQSCDLLTGTTLRQIFGGQSLNLFFFVVVILPLLMNTTISMIDF